MSSNLKNKTSSTEIDKIIRALAEFKPQLDILNTWEKIELDFSCSDIDKNRKIIKSFFNDKIGFYAIFDMNECLYIGIGRPIWKRIYSHYKAANGFEKQQRWSDFFQSYRKSLSVYYQEFKVSATTRLDDKIRMLLESILEAKFEPAFEFTRLSSEIKLLAVEEIAGSRYLLHSDKFPRYCLQVIVGEDEDNPQDRLLLIDSVIKHNCFRDFTQEEINNGARRNAINRLSKNSLEIIENIFKKGIGFKI